MCARPPQAGLVSEGASSIHKETISILNAAPLPLCIPLHLFQSRHPRCCEALFGHSSPALGVVHSFFTHLSLRIYIFVPKSTKRETGLKVDENQRWSDTVGGSFRLGSPTSYIMTAFPAEGV